MALGLEDLDELPAPRAEVVQLTLRARLQPDPEYVVLEPASGILVAPPPLFVEPCARSALVVRPQQAHRREP